jgi:hypothetical protein
MTWNDLIVLLSNPLIVSAFTSLVVALVVLGVDKMILTPRARKRAYDLHELERRLDAYGELVALLKATRKKAETSYFARQTKGKLNGFSHYVEQHDIKTLDKLFGEKARLMSPKLIDTWIEQLGKDPRQVIGEKRQQQLTIEEGLGSIGVFLDLREMEQVAESEYKRLTEQWERLARIKLNQ